MKLREKIINIYLVLDDLYIFPLGLNTAGTVTA